MRSLLYLAEAILLATWLVVFFVYGTVGVTDIPLSMLNFDLKKLAGFFRRTVQAIVFCGLIFILPGCAHYVAEVPVARLKGQAGCSFCRRGMD